MKSIFPENYCTELVHQLIRQFENKFWYPEPNKCYIYLPVIFKTYFNEELETYAAKFMNTFKGGEVVTFRGYKILPGYEQYRIIIAHEDYTKTLDERLFYSMDIIEKA